MTSEWFVSAKHEGVAQLSGNVEAGGALPQRCGVDEVSSCSRRGTGLWWIGVVGSSERRGGLRACAKTPRIEPRSSSPTWRPSARPRFAVFESVRRYLAVTVAELPGFCCRI